MNYDIEILEKYQEILGKLGQFVDPIIAGGAIRDMLLEKPVKDIDIFYKGTLPDSVVKQLFTVQAKYDKAYEESTFKVFYAKVFYKDVNLPIQLIETKQDPREIVLDDFGVNLSKVWFSQGGIVLTNEFLLDANVKVLTFKEGCSPNYVERIRNKYSDYSCAGLGSNYEEQGFFF
jgi:hypothetical protein